MALPKRTLGKSHVARGGSNMGLYDGDQIQDLLDSGQLLPTDQYFDEKSSAWIPLAQLDSGLESPAEPAGAESPSSAKSPSASHAPSGSRRSGRGGKSRKKADPALGGWIACLFALGAAAGLWAWNQNLSVERDFATEKMREQAAVIDQLRNQIDLLSGLTPPGRIQAIITYSPSAETTAIVSGATVELYRRATMDAAIQKAAVASPSSEEALFAAVRRIQAALPPPLEVGVSKSNGRVDLPVPEPGDYVLLTTTAKSSGPELIRYLWLVGFHSSDQPSKIIILNESNAISRFQPHFVVTELFSELIQPGQPPPNAPAPPASATPGATSTNP